MGDYDTKSLGPKMHRKPRKYQKQSISVFRNTLLLELIKYWRRVGYPHALSLWAAPKLTTIGLTGYKIKEFSAKHVSQYGC